MSFKVNEFKIIGEEKGSKNELKITGENSGAIEVGSFQAHSFDQKQSEKYQTIKKKYGALATSDAERANLPESGRKFQLNQLIRGPLAVEEEERRAREEQVQRRVSILAEEEKKKAHAIGYQNGFDQGKTEAYQKFREETADRVEQLDHFLIAAHQATEEIFRANEKFLMDLMYRLARMVLLKELSTDREYLLRLTRELVGRLGVRDHIKIRINPKDLELIEMLKQGLQSTFEGISHLSIEGSSDIQDGGCEIQTDWNKIDASIDRQLKGVYETLAGAGKSAETVQKGEHP